MGYVCIVPGATDTWRWLPGINDPVSRALESSLIAADILTACCIFFNVESDDEEDDDDLGVRLVVEILVLALAARVRILVYALAQLSGSGFGSSNFDPRKFDPIR